jgi:ABC-type branched-subunit amino acid transport system substrate-binding protein
VRMKTKLGLLLLVACLIGAGCGGRFNDAQKKALRAGAAGGARAASSSDGVTAGDESTAGDAATSGGDTSTGGGTSTAGGSSGGATSGGATSGGSSAAGGACTASGGATDIGVSATSVTVGNVSIMSGPVPGFGKTSQAAVQAYRNYVNSQGGVCGRKLEVINADDRFDGGANRSETEKLKPKVFAFVGGLSVVDDGGAAVLENTNIPDVGLSLSDARIRLANNFSTSPINLADGGNGQGPSLTYYKSAMGVSKGAVIWPSQAIARARAQGYVKDMERVGINPVVKAEVSVTETNYSGLAAQIKDKGVDVVMTTLEVAGMASLAKALKQQGYQPKVANYGTQAYGKQFIDRARDAAEGVTLNVAYDIFEGRANNKAMDTFLTWFARTAPGVEPDFFAILAWTASDLFVQALRAAGGAPTRDKVLAELKKITKFDAGGILAPIDPAGKNWAKCFVVVRVVNQKWQRVEPPGSGFHC